jgi:hypothetical protein
VLADLLRGCLRAARADSRPRRWYGTTIGDARAGSPAGQRQRCSGDVKHQRRYGCGAEEIAPRARHRGGRPRGWTAATTPGEARPPAGSCPSVDCGLRAFCGHGTPHDATRGRPASPGAYGSLATVSRTAESSTACNVCRAWGTIRRSPSRPSHSVASATSRTRPPSTWMVASPGSRAPTAPPRRSMR